LYGWLFGFGYFVISLYWIPIALTFDKNFNFLFPLALFLIPAFLALFYGLVSLSFIILKPKKIMSSLLVFSLIFGVTEYIRGSILTGFPWNLIVYSFSNQLEFLSVTSIFGTYGLNLFCITLFTSPALFIVKDIKKNIVVCIFFIVMVTSFFVYGFFHKENFKNAEKVVNDFKVRVIGSNIGIERFYSNVNSVLVIEELIKISDPNMSQKIIFIWPEGILPEISQKELNEYKWLFENKFNENHLLIIGINSESIENNIKKYFNSLSIYDHKLNLLNSYNKINLVPFGEFLPFENLLNKIGLKTITNNIGSFTKGGERKIIHIKNNFQDFKFLPLICYEIIYSGNLTKDNDYDFIINISEDGWFGKSVGPKQHFSHSIFRAIETGKYVLRSANNGMTAIINPLGEIEKKIDYNKDGFIDFEKRRDFNPTIFSLYGNKIFILLILLYILLIFSFNRIKDE
jgi:apolipoprotein N-acyltransferase